MTSSRIVDVEFGSLIEDLGMGWGIYECTAFLEDGTAVTGTIQGDPETYAFAEETFDEEGF